MRPPSSTRVAGLANGVAGGRRLAVVVVVVLMVTVPVPLVVVLLSVIGVVEAEHVGSVVAPLGDAVSAQLSVTDPV